MEAHKLFRRLINTAKAFSAWNKSHFGHIQTRIAELELQLLQLQQNACVSLNAHKQVIDEIRIQRERLESLFRQKSREI